jgi:hypothetical protein
MLLGETIEYYLDLSGDLLVLKIQLGLVHLVFLVVLVVQ